MKILFIHHSTGANLIAEGSLRKILSEKAPQVEFWDHSYNLYKRVPVFLGKLNYHTGLSDNNGHITGRDFTITLSNDSPKEYAQLFSKDPESSTLKSILAYDVIAFKNCFPATKITSDKQLEEYKEYYREIRDSLVGYKDKTFILFTSPPLRKELTRPEYANRAKRLVDWLKSDEFLARAKNIRVFDFFSLLADEKGMLKKKYAKIIFLDSHPNHRANEDVSKKFVDFLTESKLLVANR